MRSRSRTKPKRDGVTVMLVAGGGAHARRFQLTKRHAWIALGVWGLLMLIFATLGFYTG